MGILDDIYNKGKVFEYKPITLEYITKIMKQMEDSIKTIPSPKVLYVSRYTAILIDCISNPNYRHAKEILRLNSYIKYYSHIIELYNIKSHHIIVKHSTMSLDECNVKKRHFNQCIEDIKDKVIKLYYD
jgi:hypothetical protein